MGTHPTPTGERARGSEEHHPRVREYMNRNISVARDDDPVAFASQLLLWRGLHHLPVVDGAGHLVGVVTDHGLLGRAFDPWSHDLPVSLAMRAAHAVDDDVDVETARRQLGQLGTDVLVVLHDGAVCGLFTHVDSLRASRHPRRLAAGREAAVARDVMRTVDDVARMGDSLSLVAERLRRSRSAHLPVLFEDGRIAGVVRDADVRTLVGDVIAAVDRDGGAWLPPLTVDLLVAPAPMISAERTLEEVAECLVDAETDVVLITTIDERILGVVTAVDLLRHLVGRARVG